MGFVFGKRRRTLFLTEDDSAFRQIVGRHFERDSIPGENADEVEPHFAADVSEDHVFVFKFDPEHGVGEQFTDDAFDFDNVFRHELRPPYCFQ